MRKGRTFAFYVVLTVTVAGLVASEKRIVRMQDACDSATFNAVLGDGACVGDGDVTFGEFIAALADGGHEEWNFHFGRRKVDKGEALIAKNEGGEPHTFTEVRNFGGGSIELLNGPLGLTRVPECPALEADVGPLAVLAE